ncbi:MAG: (2Fe-2S) ferredoxin domain-containing protein [Bacteroidales bacterium]|nr:(2Fe-2S) ferredoxin domain-containing protein [Bacteroidales bacterium]TFH49232.1 MAG: (2Fe-2S) ferredoxin domain-containing protein [Bacteroidia bacterium]
MEKLKSLADLKRVREEARAKLDLRVRGDNPEGLVQVKVAMATCGIASGARPIMDFFADELDKRGIGAVVTQTGCMGYCYAEPTVEVQLPGQEPVVFGFVDRKRADEIIEKYVKNGELAEGIIPVNYEKID